MILLGPPAYIRGWHPTRTFPDLPATLDHRTLSKSEIEAWLDRLDRAAG